MTRPLLLLSILFSAGGCGLFTGDDSSDAGTGNGALDGGLRSYAPTEHSLIDHRLWNFHSDGADDPWAEFRPTDPALDCPDYSYGLYDGLWDVDTGFCAYQTFSQTTRVDLQASDAIRIELWHLQLWAPRPASATIAVALEGEIIWQEVVPVPSDYRFYNPLIFIGRAIPAGTPLHYHVHNHGLNTYRLLDIKRVQNAGDAGYWHWPDASPLDGGLDAGPLDSGAPD